MSSVQSALINRASRSGTTTQRLNATNPREGLIWFDTTNGILYRYNGTGWNAMTISESSVTSGVVTAPSGMSVMYQNMYRLGRMRILNLRVEDTGFFTPDSSNIVATLSSSGDRPPNPVATTTMVEGTGSTNQFVAAGDMRTNGDIWVYTRGSNLPQNLHRAMITATWWVTA